MRRILTIAAAAVISSAAAFAAAPSQAMTVAPKAVAATQDQTPSGLQNAAFFCRWTPWGRRCAWGPGWRYRYWGWRGPYWGWRHYWW
ncbi:MAG TPA: hypothetical protein VKX28_28330 [Xanthobacteraceae bacterium]|nr:hypothetical protein [Xanthobacteraceae bacterium]